MKLPKLQRERIYCFPNRYGFVGFGLFLVALATAGTYANNLVFIMSFLLLSLGLIAILQTARNIRATTIVNMKVKPNYAGEQAEAVVTLKNPSADIKLSTQIEYRWGGTKYKIEASEILPHDIQTLHFSISLSPKRGVYSLKKMNIATTYPYALFNAWKVEKRPEEIIVYPKPLGMDLPSQTQYTSFDEYSGHKEYEHGDSVGRMDWKAYSRTQELHVKEFKDSNQVRTKISWSEAPQQQLEDKLSQLSLWVQQAQQRNYFYSLELPNFKSEFNNGPEHFEKCMTALARMS